MVYDTAPASFEIVCDDFVITSVKGDQVGAGVNLNKGILVIDKVGMLGEIEIVELLEMHG